MAAKKSLNAIYFTGGQFSEITIDVDDKEKRYWEFQRLIGAAVLADAVSPFTAPFIIMFAENPSQDRPPTAIIVDPVSETGTDAFFGSALFFRRAGDGLASVRPGDLELVRALPLWLRFNNVERRPSIPTAKELTASRKEFDPQIHFILTDPPRRQMVFVNSLVAKFEYQVVAINVGRMVGGATSVELMLAPEVVAEAQRFIETAFDSKGRLAGAWASV